MVVSLRGRPPSRTSHSHAAGAAGDSGRDGADGASAPSGRTPRSPPAPAMPEQLGSASDSGGDGADGASAPSGGKHEERHDGGREHRRMHGVASWMASPHGWRRLVIGVASWMACRLRARCARCALPLLHLRASRPAPCAPTRCAAARFVLARALFALALLLALRWPALLVRCRSGFQLYAATSTCALRVVGP